MSLFYISFATFTTFLGITVIEGTSADGALEEATRRGLNPGGEVMILRIPWEDLETKDQAEMKSYLNRLVGEEELRANGAKKTKELPEEMQEVIEANAEVVCEECNVRGQE